MMNEKKRKDDLLKQGRGLAAISVILVIIAILLIILLCDLSFVPKGEMWERCKEEMTSYFLIDDPTDEVTRYSDKEMWQRIKAEMKEKGLVPFKSGFLCWGMLSWAQNEELTREAEREKSLNISQETAERTMEVIGDFLSEKEIFFDSPQTVDIKLWTGKIKLFFYGTYNNSFDQFLDEETKNELTERLSEVLPDKGDFLARAFVREGRCTAAVYAPDVNNLYEGTDFPYLDENGRFDEEQTWGYGWSEVHNNGYIIGYVDENGVKP